MINLATLSDSFDVRREHREPREHYIKCCRGRIFAAVLGRWRWQIALTEASVKQLAALEAISLSTWQVTTEHGQRWQGIVDGGHFAELVNILGALGPDGKRVYLPMQEDSPGAEPQPPKRCHICHAILRSPGGHPSCNVEAFYVESGEGLH